MKYAVEMGSGAHDIHIKFKYSKIVTGGNA
jgi:hypothetical protein